MPCLSALIRTDGPANFPLRVAESGTEVAEWGAAEVIPSLVRSYLLESSALAWGLEPAGYFHEPVGGGRRLAYLVDLHATDSRGELLVLREVLLLQLRPKERLLGGGAALLLGRDLVHAFHISGPSMTACL